MAAITLTADIDVSLTAPEAAALRCTRLGVRFGATLTPAQIADAFFLSTTQERLDIFTALARKSLSQAKGWDASVDEVLANPLTTRAEVDVINAPASHPSHNVRPGDNVRINVECENTNTQARFAINATAIVQRLDRTGTKVIFSNGIALDAALVTRL